MTTIYDDFDDTVCFENTRTFLENKSYTTIYLSFSNRNKNE